MFLFISSAEVQYEFLGIKYVTIPNPARLTATRCRWHLPRWPQRHLHLIDAQ